MNKLDTNSGQHIYLNGAGRIKKLAKSELVASFSINYELISLCSLDL